MRVLLFALSLLAACTSTGEQSAPAESPPAQEATSLLGRPLMRPELAADRLAELTSDLEAAQAALVDAPGSEEAVIWLGRRQAYLGRYHDAIATFTEGLERHPRSFRLLRHRGHRFLTLRMLAEARDDLELAAKLAAAAPDEVEPDGAPNALGIPRGTTKAGIWYHLGLARYLLGDYEAALAAYRECDRYARVNDDMLCANIYWMCNTLMRLGRMDEVQRTLAEVHPAMDVIENHAYHRLLLLFRGDVSVDELEAERAQEGVASATLEYGIASWLDAQGEHLRAEAILRRICASDAWPAFGFLAAEAALASAPRASTGP